MYKIKTDKVKGGWKNSCKYLSIRLWWYRVL